MFYMQIIPDRYCVRCRRLFVTTHGLALHEKTCHYHQVRDIQHGAFIQDVRLIVPRGRGTDIRIFLIREQHFNNWSRTLRKKKNWQEVLFSGTCNHRANLYRHLNSIPIFKLCLSSKRGYSLKEIIKLREYSESSMPFMSVQTFASSLSGGSGTKDGQGRSGQEKIGGRYVCCVWQHNPPRALLVVDSEFLSTI